MANDYETIPDLVDPKVRTQCDHIRSLMLDLTIELAILANMPGAETPDVPMLRSWADRMGHKTINEIKRLRKVAGLDVSEREKDQGTG